MNFIRGVLRNTSLKIEFCDIVLEMVFSDTVYLNIFFSETTGLIEVKCHMGKQFSYKR